MQKFHSYLSLLIFLVPGLTFAQNSPYPPVNQTYPTQQFVTSEPPPPAAPTNQSQTQTQTAPVPSQPLAPQVIPIEGAPAAPQPAPAPPSTIIPPLAPDMTTPPELAPRPAPSMTVPPVLAPSSAAEMLNTPNLAPSPAPHMNVSPNLAPPSAPDLVPSPLPAPAPALNRPGPVPPEQAANPADTSPQQVAQFFNGGFVENSFTGCQQMASSYCVSAIGTAKFQKCLTRLQPYPACQQFLAFAGATQFDRGDDVDLIQFYKEANLNVFHVSRPTANYPGDYYAIGVKGNFVNITSGPEVQQIDISKNIQYPQITQQFPKAGLWSYVDQPPVAQPLPNGGLRLVFRFTLLNGCGTCEHAGYAFVAYDFTSEGALKDAQLLSLQPIPVQR